MMGVNGVMATTMEMPTAADPEASRQRVLRAQAGDEAARDELALECGRDAFAFALQLTRDREDALDVAQETVLRLFRSLGRFDADRPLRPWLLSIAHNLVRDGWRRGRARRAVELDADLLVDASEEGDPERRLRRLELQRRVWRALAELPEEAREIVVLRDYRDCSYAEIAGILGIPPGTVMSRLHRARARLARLLRATDAPGGEMPND